MHLSPRPGVIRLVCVHRDSAACVCASGLWVALLLLQKLLGFQHTVWDAAQGDLWWWNVDFKSCKPIQEVRLLLQLVWLFLFVHVRSWKRLLLARLRGTSEFDAFKHVCTHKYFIAHCKCHCSYVTIVLWSTAPLGPSCFFREP